MSQYRSAQPALWRIGRDMPSARPAPHRPRPRPLTHTLTIAFERRIRLDLIVKWTRLAAVNMASRADINFGAPRQPLWISVE
ncbi:hypothetical protein ACVWWN_004546 [Mycobacterium sp. URHB0021]|jgi:hypothetical protein